MSILNESSVQAYERLMKEVGVKAKTSLQRIKAACDEIEVARGVMNYSRVAAVSTNRFGGPRTQSILNSKPLKCYIAKRVEEYEGTALVVARKTDTAKGTLPSHKQYPVEGLDARTRLFIDFLHQDMTRLDAENRYLTTMLERETQREPVSIADAIAKGPTPTGALPPALTSPKAPRIPSTLVKALYKMLSLDPQEGELSQFEVQRRGDKRKLVCTDAGIERTLLTPADWNDLVHWLKEVAP
jgi:hypothetical protein